MEHKKNVLIVHNYYQQPGGEDTVVANEMKLLKDHGHKVISYFRDNKEIKNYSRIQKIKMCFDMFFSFKTYREIKKIICKEHIEILHVHNTLNLISPSVYYAAFSCNIPVVQTMHNFRLLCPGATFYRNHHICEDCVKKGLLCSVKHKCYRNSRIQTLGSAITLFVHRLLGTYSRINYICLTEFNKEKLLMLNNSKKITINPNKVFIKPNFTYSSPVQKIVGEEYYVFIGRLEAIKGIAILMKAFAKNKRKLVIIGSGEQEAKISKLIESKKINNVTMTGQLQREEINRIVKSAKALIVPSQCYETFGMVIIEAYANQIPVIAGNIGNIGMLVHEDITGKTFQYDSWKSLNEAIYELDKSKMEQLKRNVYEVYQKKYSEEVNYSILKEIYNSI